MEEKKQRPKKADKHDNAEPGKPIPQKAWDNFEKLAKKVLKPVKKK